MYTLEKTVVRNKQNSINASFLFSFLKQNETFKIYPTISLVSFLNVFFNKRGGGLW